MARRNLFQKCAQVLALSLVSSALVFTTASWATTQELGTMQVFRIPPMFQMQAQMPAAALPPELFERLDGVSDQFSDEIQEAMAKLPPNAVGALARHGYKVTLSPTVTDAVPAARNQQVRGYQRSATWNSVFGMFNRSTKRVVMAEKAEQQDRTGKPGLFTLDDRQRRQGILRHEFGHAVDHYLGNYSHNPDFVAAYKKGAHTISGPEKEVLSYYLQPGYAGIEETFAELFACLKEDACDRDSDMLLKNHFPELVKLIKTKVASIKA